MTSIQSETIHSLATRHREFFDELMKFKPVLKEIAEKKLNRTAEEASIQWLAYDPVKGIPVQLISPAYGHNETTVSLGTVRVTLTDIDDYYSAPVLQMDDSGLVRDQYGKVLGRVER